MEIRVNPPSGAYVDTSIPKVAETPLEGCDESGPKTFGPFATDPAPMSKTPNSKGYCVRFEDSKDTVDTIEKAIDSIIKYIDDVRDPAKAPRGGKANSCMNAVADSLDCVNECRNPCADPCSESFGKMQPPVDLMLNVESESSGPVEEEKRDEADPREDVPEVSSTTVEKRDGAAVTKEDVAKGVKTAPTEGNVLNVTVNMNPVFAMPTYSTVETIGDKMRTLVPEDTLKSVMDAFILKTGEVRPDADDLVVKDGVDEDPIVEVIDRIIMFFDDLQEALKEVQTDHAVAVATPSIQATLRQKKEDILMEKEAEEAKADATPVDTDKPEGKTDNTPLLSKETKPKDTKKLLELAEQEYQEAMAAAAELLAGSAFPADKKACEATKATLRTSKEESHKQALERIMAEDAEDAPSDSRTEAKLLEELIKDQADQTIMETRSDSDEEAENKDSGRKEEVVVLGHAGTGTLTPIPEADEASSGTPASDMIEQGVITGSAPEVPLLPTIASENEEVTLNENNEQTSKTAEANVATKKKAAGASTSPALQEEKQEEEMKVEEEADPIIKFIDGLFLLYDELYDDLNERKDNISCDACPAFPADLFSLTGNSKLSAEAKEAKAKEEPEETKQEITEADVEKMVNAKIEPRVTEFKTLPGDDPRGQLMLQEALKLVQQASNSTSKDGQADAEKKGPETSELVEKLAETFNESEKVELMKNSSPSPRLVDIEKKFITAHGITMTNTEKNRAIAKLLEVAFENSDAATLRKTLNAVVGDPAVVTPQMSLDTDTDKQQGTKVEFEIPELMKQNQDPYIAWGGDDSELMASINADRKLSEMEHENIFRDVSKGLQESSVGIITRVENKDVPTIHNAPAFTEGNSSSAELPDEQNPAQMQAALKVLCAEASDGSTKGQKTSQSNDEANKAGVKDTVKKFEGWSLSKKREEMLRTRVANPSSIAV